MLKVLLLLYCGGLGIFAVISALLWYARRSVLTARLALFWSVSLFALAANATGIAVGLRPDVQAVVEAFTAYGTTLTLSWLLAPVYRHRALHWVDGLFLLLGLAGWWSARIAEAGFVFATLPWLPFVLAPLVRPAVSGLRRWRDITFSERMLVPLLWLILLHQADYPWLRSHEEFAVVGFSFMLFLLLASAALLFVVVTERELRTAGRKVADARMAGRGYRLQAEHSEAKLQDLQRVVAQKRRFELVGSVSTSVVHDLRNLLGLWSGNLELLLREQGPLAPVQATALAGLRNANAKAEQLLARIVALLRDPVGGVKQEQSIATAIHNVLRTTSGAVPDRLALETDIQVDATVWAAPGQLEQAVLNLVANAIQAHQDAETQDPWVRITVREAANAGALEVAVSDNGPGIAPELLARLAERATAPAVEEGGGLGLSIVHTIVRDLGGELRIESAPAQGACFRVLLPLHHEERCSAPAVGQRQASRAAKAVGQRILIVDDEPDIGDLLSRAFALNGLCSATFTDPKQALDWFAANSDQIDVLVTDHHMPGLTGENLAAACLAIRPNIRCVLMTGDRETEMRARDRERFVAVFRKPFEVNGLIEFVRPWVHGPVGSADAPREGIHAG